MYCVTSGCLLLLFYIYSVTARVLPRFKLSFHVKASNENPLIFIPPIPFRVANSMGYKLICSANPNAVNLSDVQSISWVVKPDNGPDVRIDESSTGRITNDVVKNAEEYKNTLIIKKLEQETYRCEMVTKKGNIDLPNWFSFKFDDCFLRSRAPPASLRPAPSKNPLSIAVSQPDNLHYPMKLVCRVDPALIDNSDIKSLSWFMIDDDDSLVEITESSSEEIKIDAATNGKYQKALIINKLAAGQSVFKCKLETEMRHTYLTVLKISTIRRGK